MRLIPGILIFLFFIAATRSAENKQKEVKKVEERKDREDNLQTADARQKARHVPLDDEYEDHGEGTLEVSSESYRGDKHLKGNQNLGDAEEEHTTDMHHDKGGYQDFSQGGLNYNKHHKENVADNKELENVKQHDAGEKFGAEALKEHKLGKHKEKSKGHKLNGFKNTYHKEEYGDHKTFHDEFLDTDHHHNYDDHHEHRQLQGGKFSKGFKHEGKNKNFDEVDETSAWGKEGHDGYDEGQYERGGHGSSHHHGHKKHEGHHEASAHEGGQSHKKVKKGDAPQYYSGKPHKAHYDNYHPEHDKPSSYSYHGQEHDKPSSYSYHGQENYPSYPPVENNHYSSDHSSYTDHEERSAPKANNVLIEEPRHLYAKPAAAKNRNRAPLEHLNREPLEHLHREPLEFRNREPVEYINRAPVTHINHAPREHLNRAPMEHMNRAPMEHLNRAPVEHLHRAPLHKELPSELSMPAHHNVKHKHESEPYYKPSVRHAKQQPVEKHYSQPVSVQYSQFYHRGPQHQFPTQAKPRENIFHGQNVPSRQYDDHNVKPQEHAQQIRGYSHLNSHLDSKPYDWRDRGATNQKYQASEPRAPSRFDVGKPNVRENHQRTHYIPTESHRHYIYH